MKTIKQIFSKNILHILSVLAGVLIGWIIFDGNTAETTLTESQTLTEKESEIWTCSMHPQIKMDKKGKCPICAMDLIPLKNKTSKDEAVGDYEIQMSEEAIALANVQTVRVSKENPEKTIRLYGKIVPDERSLQSQAAYVGGRIESLAINFTGETVAKGQTLATLYSPDLFTAQQELLQAASMKNPLLLNAAKEKLLLWNMTEAQIEEILKSGKASSSVDIKANTSGIVMTKRVNRGDYISQGDILFDIANLSQVWAVFNAFEKDLPFLQKNDKVKFTLSALPGKIFSGKISFIDPIINATTRTARIRVEIDNHKMELKPEMYATAEISTTLKGLEGKITVPQSAVLWTGKRSIVYVRHEHMSMPTFQLREIELGPSLGGSYVVLEGLKEGEEVVSSGAYVIDASAQLEGKPSMMNNNNHNDQLHHSHDSHSHNSVKHAMFRVEGNCNMCKERIENAAKEVIGVISAHWDKEEKIIHLQYDSDKTNEKEISKSIANKGHDTETIKADNDTYIQLPACCQYRKQ